MSKSETKRKAAVTRTRRNWRTLFITTITEKYDGRSRSWKRVA